ncbi:hypothetical protein HYFRA_00004915 [Hymenoscyphus fraxineus]|uniref:EF-hand domain-containing protein n=1 Tax=Hymenoscyphus fraxineus TaxID=746836 RepID=A0A9N9KNL9_9HELO|nr:hypothetical protein HYFRA_00004915 [Hymenoscyphus fraxineus]
MSFFQCCACSESIPEIKARLRCQDCSLPYDLCTNCFMVGNVSHAHQLSHETSLIVTSGHDFAALKELKHPSIPIANPYARRRTLNAPPSLPPRPESQTALPYHQGPPPTSAQQPTPSPQPASYQSPQFQQNYQSNSTSTYASPALNYQNVPPPPPPSSQPVLNYSSAYSTQNNNAPAQPSSTPSFSPQSTYSSTPIYALQPTPPQYNAQQLPTGPTPQQYNTQPAITPGQPPAQYNPQQSSNSGINSPTQWQTLQVAGKPTPFLESCLTEVFKRVDVNRAGVLSPEQYSAFLDVQQYKREEDVWKKFCVPRPHAYNGEDLADYELRSTYESFGIEFKLQTRTIAPISQLPPISGGLTPMITSRGFIDITFIELFSDETPLGWQRMNMILRHYGVWRELGDIPRDVWPATPPEELKRSVAVLSEAARRKAVNAVNANKAKLDMEALGRQNAIDLIDGTRRTYYYQY